MIETIKDLEKLLVMCRKNGAYDVEFHGIKFKLGDLPMDLSVSGPEQKPLLVGFPEGELTPEQLMFYSAGGHPDDDPALKDKAS